MTQLGTTTPLNDGSILLRIANAIENTPRNKTRLSSRTHQRCAEVFWNKGLEYIVRYKVHKGQLRSGDLESERVLVVAEKYLREIYPDLNWPKNPAYSILFSRTHVQNTTEAIEGLILASELEDLSAEELENPQKLQFLQQQLFKLYPDLDLSEDPASEILAGPWREEVERVIDQLIDAARG